MTDATANPSIDAASDPRARLARQSLLPGFGTESVERLRNAHAAIVGMGALGTVSAELLARAGVGTLTIIDRDLVEATNLQRQTLYVESDARQREPKVVAASRALSAISSSTVVRAHAVHLDSSNAEDILRLGRDGAPGVILDGTDNFRARLLLNDLAVKHITPMVYTAAVGTRAMLATILPAPPEGVDAPWDPSPCLRELIDVLPPASSVDTCDTVGVLGTVTAAAASFQATEALKIVLGRFDLLRKHLLAFDPWNTEFSRVGLGPDARDPECPCCGQRVFEHLDRADQGSDETLCGQYAVQLAGAGAVDLDALEASFRKLGEVDRTRAHVAVVLRDEPADGDAIEETEDGRLEIAVFQDGRAIVTGTTSIERARGVFDRYVGS